MSCTGTADCTCGCCAGASIQTPQVETNPLGQSSIAYRVGTWATFKESMLARLSSSDYPALSFLHTRDDDDFTVAFLDATAIVLDILTFYQERLANESYLRTATQLRSLVELSRLIGYQPSPGVSASTYLAFTLKATPGVPPSPSTPAITIPAGTQVQSVPAQGQTPQVFETSTAIQAKSDWNALPVQTGIPWQPGKGQMSLYLQGTSTQLQPGNSLLILGANREAWASNITSAVPPSDWEVVVLNQVQVDNVRSLTYVAWDRFLAHGSTKGTSAGWTVAKVFAFSQKAGLFGNNAPQPNLFVNAQDNKKTNLPELIDDRTMPWQWRDFQVESSGKVDLDSTYQKIVVGSWFALTFNGIADLYNAQQVATVSLANFGLSGKVTELSADYVQKIADTFPLRSTQVWAQSNELAVAEQPLTYPLYGTWLDLDTVRPDLVGVQVVAISGTAQKIQVNDGVTKLTFIPDDISDTQQLPLNPGDTLTITSAAPLLQTLATGGPFPFPDWTTLSTPLTLNVQDSAGRPGTVQAALSQFTLAPPATTDPQISECALVSNVIVDAPAIPGVPPFPHTLIVLQSNLLNCYNRTVTTVNANVAAATAGQSVSEIMGSGAGASSPNQEFTLKQSPLTFIQASTPTGSQSTLQVQVNGAAWTQVPSLYQQSASAQAYTTLNEPDGTTDVLFGDGVEGATVSVGQNNIQANYRIGLGSAGNVAVGAISTLMDRPLGVSGVTNPQAATGGQDPDSIDDIRTNAPQSVVTLGRAVSITDYQNFANTFAGISQANAVWIPYGPGRGVFLTVAGVNGASLTGTSTLSKLVTALQSYGNALIPIAAQSFLETLFSLSADIAYDQAYDQPAVQAAVLQALYQTYSFANRAFGQGVSADEVASVIQAVAGVVAVNVTSLNAEVTSTAGDLAGLPGGFTLANYNSWVAQQLTGAQAQQLALQRPTLTSPTSICAYLPAASYNFTPLPAEILVLDPNPNNVVLGTLT
jgi:hypothetical protein